MATVYTDLSYWHTGRKFDLPVFTTPDIYIKALRLLNSSGYKKPVRNLAVSVYSLVPGTDEQLEMFASPTHAVAEPRAETKRYPRNKKQRSRDRRFAGYRSVSFRSVL